MFLHEFQQLALAHDRIRQVQASKLNLLRTRRGNQALQKPVVERTVNLELQSADRVGDVFDRILQRMCEIIHRIDAPLIAASVMGRMPDTVNDRIAHVNVRRRHIDLGTQNFGTVFKFPGAHTGKQIKVFFNGTVAVGTLFSGSRQCAAVFAHLGIGKFADIRLAELDQLNGILIKLLEIIRSEEQFVLPVRAEPADILHDGLHVFGVLFGRIRIVEAEVERAVVFLRGAVVQADRLCMADMKVSVRFRGETGYDPAVGFASLDLPVDHLMNEIGCGSSFIVAHI